MFPSFCRAQQSLYYSQLQKKQLDSLQLALKNTTNDTVRMDLSRKLGFYYRQIQRDSSLYFTEQQLFISQKLKLKLYEADAFIYIGYLNKILGNYPLSLQSLLKALKIAEDPASENSVWGLSKGESPRDARLSILASNHNILGELYGATGNTGQQLSHYRQCEKFAVEINNTFQVALANMNLGNVYNNLNKLDSALAFEMKALDYSSRSFNKNTMGIILNLIGTIYYKKGNYALAKQYFSEGIQVTQKQNNLQSLAGIFVSLANLFMETGDSDSSLLYAKKGLKIFQSVGFSSGLVFAYTSLSSIYKMRNNMDSAFIYQGLAMAAKDSLNNAEKIMQVQNIGFDEQLRHRELEEERIQIQNKIRTYAMLAGIAVFMLIAFLLFRNNRNRKKANTLLQKQKEEIELQKKNVEQTLAELKSTQSQLIQSEKMASLGELTAGIAHEIQNPLNFVNNFSEVNKELLVEMNDEIEKGNYNDVKAIAKDVIDNQEKINHHGKRADAIVKGMLQHSRSSVGVKEPTDINALADEYLRLAYHGLRAKDNSFNATIKTDFDKSIGNINVIPQDIGRVILNLLTNAFYAASQNPPSGGRGANPTVWVRTDKTDDRIFISVRDNGPGIPRKVLDKIFQPFFTTKPTGQGTGLGLSISYDIVKAHGGELKVETREGEGTEFIIQLPNA